MSVNKLGVILFSSFLILATAPGSFAQSTASQDQSAKKQTTTQSTASKASKDDIRSAQQALKDKGLYTGVTDGTMNAETQKALRDFQQKNNLKVTGSLNHETMAALGTTHEQPAANPGKAAASERKATGTADTTPSKSATPASNKKERAPRGKDTSSLNKNNVRETQTALKQQGFDPGPIDGVLGPMTMTALRNYQSHNGLEVTGNINAETQNSLTGTAAASSSGNQGGGSRRNQRNYDSRTQDQNRNNNQNQNQNQRYRDRSANENSQPLDSSQKEFDHQALGINTESNLSNVDDIRQVQESLAGLMYNPGDANGMLTEQTRQAIREFQWLNDLPVTGNVDAQTKIAIDTQASSGLENAQLNPSFSSDLEREKPSINSEQQTQPRTDRSSSTYSSSSSSSSSPSVQSSKDKSYDSNATSDTKHHSASGKVDKDASERVSKAAAVLQDLTASADKRIPNDLLDHAEAIAVIPNMIKGAFGIGGRYGKGVVSQRMDNGRWSQPSFLEIGGGSFGAQIGVTSTDLVLVFTDRKALDQLQGGKDLKLGVDAGVAAGPIGRSAEAGVNVKLDTAIYAYSRSKGLFAGIALDGAVLNIDKDTNEKVYGVATAQDILAGKVATNSTVRPFMDTVEKVMPKKRISQK